MPEACLDSKELNLKGMESEVKCREVPTDEAAVKSSETMKKQHRRRHLAVERRGEPKELTRGICGSQKLAIACRNMSRRARVAWCKRNIIRNKWTRAKDE
jgi:hypothetical protein